MYIQFKENYNSYCDEEHSYFIYFPFSYQKAYPSDLAVMNNREPLQPPYAVGIFQSVTEWFSFVDYIATAEENNWFLSNTKSTYLKNYQE